MINKAKIHEVAPKFRRALQEGNTGRLNDQQREHPHQGRTGNEGATFEVNLPVAFGELDPDGGDIGFRRNYLA